MSNLLSFYLSALHLPKSLLKQIDFSNRYPVEKLGDRLGDRQVWQFACVFLFGADCFMLHYQNPRPVPPNSHPINIIRGYRSITNHIPRSRTLGPDPRTQPTAIPQPSS
jgi:hypothetical protein